MHGEWSDPARVTEYLGRELPHRGLAHELVREALPERVDAVLDLGTGDGRMLALVRELHPDARAVGIDGSEAMLALARERFAGDPSVELRLHDLAEPLGLTGPFDVVVSGLAIHHVEHDRKRTLFAEILSLLRPGGLFANLDLATAPTPAEHHRFRVAIGRVQDDPSDRLAPLEDQLAWLAQAGFANVDCRFKWRELTLLVGARPERPE